MPRIQEKNIWYTGVTLHEPSETDSESHWPHSHWRVTARLHQSKRNRRSSWLCGKGMSTNRYAVDSQLLRCPLVPQYFQGKPGPCGDEIPYAKGMRLNASTVFVPHLGLPGCRNHENPGLPRSAGFCTQANLLHPKFDKHAPQWKSACQYHSQSCGLYAGCIR